MADIQQYLDDILKARYGKDVRQSIHDAIQQCYKDSSGDALNTIFSFGEMEEIEMNRGYIYTASRPGTAISITPTDSDSWEYALLDCEEGDRFTIYGTGGNDGRLFCFVDASNKVLCSAPRNVNLDSTVIEAPKNSKKIIINRNTTNISSPCYKGSLSGYLFLETVTVNNNRYINKNTGSISLDTSVHGATDYISVDPDTEYFMYGVVLTGNAGIAEYGESLNLIKVHSGTAVEGYSLVTNSQTRYLRVTTYNDGHPIIGFKYDLQSKLRSIFSNREIYIDKTNIVKGYPNYSDGRGFYLYPETTDTIYYRTDYIEIIPNSEIVLALFGTGGYGYAYFFNEDKNFIGRVYASTVISTVVQEVVAPKEAKYMMLTLINDYKNSCCAFYKNPEILDKTPFGLFDEYGFKRGIQLFAKRKGETPIITVIDDDTSSVEYVEKYHQVCNSLGILGTYSVITDNLVSDSGIKDRLLSYEKEGHGMLYHCKSQETYYNAGSSRNFDMARNNFVDGLRKMNEFGFLDYKYWISPYGVHDNDMQNLARHYGMKCLISTANNFSITENQGSYNLYCIPRCSLNPEDEQPNYTYSLEDLKEEMDRCYKERGWIIVTTHVNTWSDGNEGESRFIEAMNYAKEKGFSFKTFAEAFSIWEPTFILNSMF